MDQPAKTFAFIQSVKESATNNGILPYATVGEARSHLKRQLAHLFGDLLRNQFNTLTTSVKDVLSEIKTLRHELSGGRAPDVRFLLAIRFLVDEANNDFRKLIERTSGPIDTAVPIVYEAKTLADFLGRVGFQLKLWELPPDDKKGETFFKAHDKEMNYGASFVMRYPSPNEDMALGHWATTRTHELIITPVTLEHFEDKYRRLKQSTDVAQHGLAPYGVPGSVSEK